MHKWMIKIPRRLNESVWYRTIHDLERSGFVVVSRSMVADPSPPRPYDDWRYTVQHHSKHAMMIHMLTVDANLFTVISEYSNA
jgi:hypothetical protein